LPEIVARKEKKVMLFMIENDVGKHPHIAGIINKKQYAEKDVMQPFHKQKIKANRGHLPES